MFTSRRWQMANATERLPREVGLLARENGEVPLHGFMFVVREILVGGKTVSEGEKRKVGPDAVWGKGVLRRRHFTVVCCEKTGTYL